MFEINKRNSLNLLLHALIFVVKTVVFTVSCQSRNEFCHFVLVQIQRAAVAVGIFVVLIKFTALAACFSFYAVFRKIHNYSNTSVSMTSLSPTRFKPYAVSTAIVKIFSPFIPTQLSIDSSSFFAIG